MNRRPPGDSPPQQVDPGGLGQSRTSSCGALKAPENSAHLHGLPPFRVAHVLSGWGNPRASFEGVKVDVKGTLGDRISDKKDLDLEE